MCSLLRSGAPTYPSSDDEGDNDDDGDDGDGDGVDDGVFSLFSFFGKLIFKT